MKSSNPRPLTGHKHVFVAQQDIFAKPTFVLLLPRCFLQHFFCSHRNLLQSDTASSHVAYLNGNWIALRWTMNYCDLLGSSRTAQSIALPLPFRLLDRGKGQKKAIRTTNQSHDSSKQSSFVGTSISHWSHSNSHMNGLKTPGIPNASYITHEMHLHLRLQSCK